MQKKTSNPDMDKDVSMKSGLEGRNNTFHGMSTGELRAMSQ